MRRLFLILAIPFFLGCLGDDEKNKSESEAKPAEAPAKAAGKTQESEGNWLVLKMDPVPRDETCITEPLKVEKEMGGLVFKATLDDGRKLTVSVDGHDVIVAQARDLFVKNQQNPDSDAPLLEYTGEFKTKKVALKESTVRFQSRGECLYKIGFLISVE